MEIKTSRKETIQLDQEAMKEIIALGLEVKYGKAHPFSVSVRVDSVMTGCGMTESTHNVVSALAERDL